MMGGFKCGECLTYLISSVGLAKWAVGWEVSCTFVWLQECRAGYTVWRGRGEDAHEFDVRDGQRSEVLRD